MFSEEVVALVTVSTLKIHVGRPREEASKIDKATANYPYAKGGSPLFSPIPPSTFRGALRTAARIVAGKYGLKEEYESLFGGDVREHFKRELGIERLPPEIRPGKLRVTVESSPGETIRVVQPGIKINPKLGVIEENKLYFTEYAVSKAEGGAKPIEITFKITTTEPLSPREKALLLAALRLLKNAPMGGGASRGASIIREIPNIEMIDIETAEKELKVIVENAQGR